MLFACVFQLKENVRKLEERLGASENLVEQKVSFISKTIIFVKEAMSKHYV